MTRNYGDYDVGRTLEETDDECHRLRQELEALRSNRFRLRNSRSKDIQLMECQYRNAKEKLHRKLPEHANIATYNQFLRHYQRDICRNEKNNNRSKSHTLPFSNYIVQQETPLLSAMHRSFCVLAHQMELLEREHEREIYPYFRKEIQDLHLESQEVTDNWMSRLSDLAEDNDTLYESYRTELEGIEIEIKRYRRLLFQETAEKKAGKERGEGCDESSILSETEHLTDSEDENSSRGKDGVGFFKEALLLFGRSPKKDKANLSKIDSISESVHEHLCKGGAAFQIATNNFLLPFMSKDGKNHP